MDNKEINETKIQNKDNLTQKDMATVPFFVHEAEMTRLEKIIEDERAASNLRLKHSWILSIILCVIIAGMSAGFLLYESQFETISVVQDAYNDKEGGTAIIKDIEVGNTYYGSESEAGN